MSDVMTEPGTTRVSSVKAPTVPNTEHTAFTTIMDFSAVKHLLVDKPLRVRPRSAKEENAADLAAIEAAKSEGEPRDYSKVRRELGLGD